MDEIRLHVVACSNAEKDASGAYVKATTVTPQQFSDLIGRVNAYFAPAQMKFLFDPDHDWATLPDTSINTDSATMRAECNAMAAELPGKMLCVLRWGGGDFQTGNGNAYPPPGAGPKPPSVGDVEQNYVALPSGLFDFQLLNQGNGTFVAHEFGHFFGLYHTFPGWSSQDPIYSGLPAVPSKEQAIDAIVKYVAANGTGALDGDLLDDTPPDPNPVLWQAFGADICTTPTIEFEVKLGIAKAKFSFTPDPNNLMSYFAGCPSANAPGISSMSFSPKQIERMRSTLGHKNRKALTASPVFGQQSLQPGNAVAPSATRLQVVAADSSGRVWLANWDNAKNGGKWDRWRPVLPDNIDGPGQVRVATRDPSRLDIFVVDKGGRVRTGARAQGVAGGKWGGWWGIVEGQAQPGGAVTAVSRFPDQLDAFVVGLDGGIYTAAWNRNHNQAKWAGWWRIGSLTAPLGAPVTAVSRGPDHLDIFVADKEGRIHTTGWSSGGQWRPWKWILGGKTKAGGSVTAVAREPDRLDIFTAGTDGAVYTAAWHKAVNNGEWLGWWRIGTRTLPPGSPVGAVARTADSIDVFIAASDGKVHASGWAQTANQGKWPEWTGILNGEARVGSAVTAVARTPDRLDIFAVRNSGGLHTAAWMKGAAGGWKGWWKLP